MQSMYAAFLVWPQGALVSILLLWSVFSFSSTTVMIGQQSEENLDKEMTKF